VLDIGVLERDINRPDTLRTVVESAPLALCGFDADGLVCLWNPACEAMFG
jgi:PAS domain-containing protein